MEVRVFRDGELLTRELCESEEDAAAVVESWEETEGVECVVEDLSVTARDESTLEVEVDADGDRPAVFDRGEDH